MRIAIVGCGFVADYYKKTMSLHPELELVGVMDRNPERASHFSTYHSVPAYESLQELLGDERVETVINLTNPRSHYEVTKAALEAGKHAICEKPLAGSLEEVDQLIKISQITKKNIYPVFQYRFGKGTKQLNLLIESGLAGKPFVASLETYWNRDSNYYDNEWRGTWKGERGGAILGHAIHIHDLLTMVFGEIFSVSLSKS